MYDCLFQLRKKYFLKSVRVRIYAVCYDASFQEALLCFDVRLLLFPLLVCLKRQILVGMHICD